MQAQELIRPAYLSPTVPQPFDRSLLEAAPSASSPTRPSTPPPSYLSFISSTNPFKMIASDYSDSFEATLYWEEKEIRVVSTNENGVIRPFKVGLNADMYYGYKVDDATKQLFKFKAEECYPVSLATTGAIFLAGTSALVLLGVAPLVFGILFANPIVIGVGVGLICATAIGLLALGIFVNNNVKKIRNQPIPDSLQLMTNRNLKLPNGKYVPMNAEFNN